MKLLRIGERIINLDLVVEAHRRDSGDVDLTFAVTAFDTADTRTFHDEEAQILWCWLMANVEDVQTVKSR